jgi:RNA polymerase sigma-70 factor (ECF subfamily)
MPQVPYDFTESTDEEIIAQYKAGNQEAFKSLINRYASALYNFTARLGSRNDASDIVAETFIKVWKNIHRFDSKKASFKTWIFTIARNTATDFLRKKRSLLFSDLQTTDEENSNSPAANIESFVENIEDDQILPDLARQKMQDKEFLEDILNSLRPSWREILVLHYQEEMTFDEIGKILNKPLNTVKSAHRRALIELRKKVD